MKVVLVHPHGSNWLASSKDISSIFNLMPPLGLMSIAAYLHSHQISVELVDCHAQPLPPEEQAKRILARSPQIVGFSCTTSSFPEGYRLAQAIKGEASDVVTLFGGPHATSLGAGLLDRFPAIDYLVLGEGEKTLLDLVQNGGRNPAHIPGIAYRQDGKGIATAPREQIGDLDTLPFPAYRLLPRFPRRYNLPLFNYPKSPNTSVISSRGCPYSCSYCDRSVFGSGYRFNSAEYLFEHLLFLYRDFGIRHVSFYDDLFTLDRRRVEEFCRLLAGRKLPVTFNCIGRLDHVDEELVKLLKKGGCWQMNFGIESGDPDVLGQYRKFLPLEEVGRRLYLVKKAGMRVKGLFMVGLPGEDEASIRRTIDYALSLPLDEINVTKFTPFPGAPLYRRIRELGEFDEEWELMNCMNFVFVPHGITSEKLEELYNEFIRSFYRRGTIYRGYGAMLWKSPHSFTKFFRHLPEIVKFAVGQRW